MKRKSQSSLEYPLMIAVAVLALVSMFSFMRGSLSGKWRKEIDVFGGGEIFSVKETTVKGELTPAQTDDSSYSLQDIRDKIQPLLSALQSILANLPGDPTVQELIMPSIQATLTELARPDVPVPRRRLNLEEILNLIPPKPYEDVLTVIDALKKAIPYLRRLIREMDKIIEDERISRVLSRLSYALDKIEDSNILDSAEDFFQTAQDISLQDFD